jgi:hypothetical protein
VDVCFLSYVKAVKLFSKPLCTSSTVLPGVNCAHFKMTIKNNKVLCRASLFIKFYAYIFRFSYVGEVLSALFKLGGLVPIIIIVLFLNQFTIAPTFLCGFVRVSGSSYHFCYYILHKRYFMCTIFCFFLDHMSVS